MSFFAGKKVWITGASSGIGEQLAYALSKAGAHIIISARRQSELERVKNACFSPKAVDIIPFDQSQDDQIVHACHSVFAQHTSIDFLFNNGGISQRGEALMTDIQLERQIFQINFFGNILLSKLVAKKMADNGGGHLVITSSLLGKWGFHLRSTYAATKHALHGYYDSMRMEVENKGIRITLLMPGFIATDISKNALNEKGNKTGEMDQNQAGGMSAEESANRILEGVASGKTEFGIGGKEILGLKIRRFFPSIFEKILRKKSAR